jgi:hypothetical protein
MLFLPQTGIDILRITQQSSDQIKDSVSSPGNIQNMSVDAIHVPSKLNDSYLHS